MLLWTLLCFLPLCLGQRHFPTTPDYDDNSTFSYSFYSNTSHDELEEFLNSSDSFNFNEEEEEAVTMATPLTTAPGGGVRGAAPPPVCADVQQLLLILMILNFPQLHL